MNEIILKYFKRPTNTTSFIPEIDGLRFFAIITVVVFHLNTAFSRELGLSNIAINELGGKDTLLKAGWWIIRLDLGVKVFFSISGFILSIPFLNQYLYCGRTVSLKDFYIRRLTRLEPPFVISLLFFLLIHVIILGEPFLKMLPHFLSGLFYAHVFIFGHASPINPPTWSLETEAQFYLLVPALFAILFFLKHRIFTFVIGVSIFVCSIILRNYSFSHNWTHWGSSVFIYFSNFFIGIYFAFLYLHFKDYFKKKSAIWDILGIIFVLGLFVFYKPQAFWLNNILFNACTLGFMCSAFKGKYFNWFFTRTIIYLIGGMCYTIYLLHYAFFHLWVKFVGHISLGFGYLYDFILQILIAIPFIILISSLFYVTIEKPCMNKNWPILLSKWFNKSFSS